jgi:predicted RNase H-like HicB family nuclease
MEYKEFSYRILTEWSDADGCYVARVPAFPLLAAHGETASEAAAEAQSAAESMLGILGNDAPPPDKT